MNKVNCLLYTGLLSLASCSTSKIFTHDAVSEKGNKQGNDYFFQKGRNKATRLCIITPEKEHVRYGGTINFESNGKKEVVYITKANRGITWDGEGFWNRWVQDDHIEGKELYVIFLRGKLAGVPEAAPLKVSNNAFPTNSEFYLWRMPIWSFKKVE